MIEIFKTTVESSGQAASILGLLHLHFPATDINFDLDDCDRILRVKGEMFCPVTVIRILRDNGFECRALD